MLLALVTVLSAPWLACAPPPCPPTGRCLDADRPAAATPAHPRHQLATFQAPEPGLRIGVDTHSDVYVAAAVDELGRLRATLSVPTTLIGLQRLHAWARQLGPVVAWGIEGTGSYGARLAGC